MIQRLRAQNFKSWKDTGDLRLAPLTGLFGTNSSGKTSILQLLLMLRQTAESPDRKRVLNTGDERSLVDLGTFFDLVHGHDEDAMLEISVSWGLPLGHELMVPVTEGRSDELSFTTSIRAREEGPTVERFEYASGRFRFGMERQSSAEGYELRVTRGYPLKRRPGRPRHHLPSPVRCYGFPDQVAADYQNVGFLSDLVLAFERCLSGIAYLGPLREYPKRVYLWSGDSPVDVGARGEHSVAALLAARQREAGEPGNRRRRGKGIEERIARWLREMGLIHSYVLRPVAKGRRDYEVRVRKTETSPEVLLPDVGFGVSQILPVLVLCYYVPVGSTVILEQPEIHLHPSVQASLADVFIDVIRERQLQIIVESHSEHLLRRLQRRIAEGGISSADTALYFCRAEGPASRIDALQVDLFGNISNWPEGFFGDEMEDLVAMTQAAMERTHAQVAE